MADNSLYQPLDSTRDEFRLLRLQPSDNLEDIITCQLFTVSLFENPSYTTLSYEWGDKNVTEPMLVNETEVQVTCNLHAALRRIRQAHPEAIIWVDVVCINQNDVAERNTQVAMMGRLYSKTTLGYSWLGEEKDEKAENAVRYVRGFTQRFSARVVELGRLNINIGKELLNELLKEVLDQTMEDIRSSTIMLYLTDVKNIY